MSYLVLARKWRPKTFEDVIGQQYITLTLRNAVTSGKLAHALIFSGPRGVGKTTTARIVAKSINCERSNTESLVCVDNFCSFCSEISEGISIDVQEIDAASHTGVNDVREIIDNVKYLPSSAKTKVYIIDEAHMLSQAAFNALLKTLEEPPGHVLFILATTEPHKIPATIQSRCQRYDFKKLSLNEIKSQLEQIVSVEGIEVDQETLLTISKEADGSIRDALSILDQLIATFGNKISYRETLDILGLLDKTHLNELLQNIIEKNPKSSIEILNRITSRGITHSKIADNLVGMIRNSLLIKICGDDVDLDLTDDDINELKQLVAGKSTEDLELLFSLAIENAENVHKSSFTELSLESMVIKLASTDTTVPINEIIGKIENLSGKLGKTSQATVESKESPKGVAPDRVASTSSPELEMKADESKHEVIKEKKEKPDTFSSFVQSNNTILGIHLEKADNIIKEEKILKIIFNESTINYEYLRKRNSINSINSLADEFYGNEMKIIVELQDNKGHGIGADTETKSDESSEEDNLNVIGSDDPVVNDAINIFDGKILKNKGR